jgi:hypothetical protein
MKLDPADVFADTAGGLVVRCLCAWIAVWAGLIGAVGSHALGFAYVLLLPFWLLAAVIGGGAWMLLTAPLVACLAWRALRFIRGDGSWQELGILTMLSLLVCLPASRGPSILGFVIFPVGAMLLAARLREAEMGE